MNNHGDKQLKSYEQQGRQKKIGKEDICLDRWDANEDKKKKRKRVYNIDPKRKEDTHKKESESNFIIQKDR